MNEDFQIYTNIENLQTREWGAGCFVIFRDTGKLFLRVGHKYVEDVQFVRNATRPQAVIISAGGVEYEVWDKRWNTVVSLHQRVLAEIAGREEAGQ